MNETLYLKFQVEAHLGLKKGVSLRNYAKEYFGAVWLLYPKSQNAPTLRLFEVSLVTS